MLNFFMNFILFCVLTVNEFLSYFFFGQTDKDDKPNWLLKLETLNSSILKIMPFFIRTSKASILTTFIQELFRAIKSILSNFFNF